nr:hypothetical protein [uncultured bacterium]
MGDALDLDLARLVEEVSLAEHLEQVERAGRHRFDAARRRTVTNQETGAEPLGTEPDGGGGSGDATSGDDDLGRSRQVTLLGCYHLAVQGEVRRIMVGVRSLHFRPPLAIARVGGSPTPLAAYRWAEDHSREGGGLTFIEPAVSLRVTENGSVSSFLPRELVFSDSGQLRPVAPFLELWLELEDGTSEPLTSKFLTALGAALGDVQYVVEAANRKAQRRTGDPACAFSARATLDHSTFTPVELLAWSDPAAGRPLVLPDRPISLGQVQAIRPTPGPVEAGDVDLDVLRLRFTPAKGSVYGPPNVSNGLAACPGLDGDRERLAGGAISKEFEIVPLGQRILNDPTAWTQYRKGDRRRRHPLPSNTYDGSEDARPGHGGRSWGVVDDTCDVLVTATVRVGDTTHRAHARIVVGPPDYAPDRRPFMSLVDELLDRVEPDPPFNRIDAEVEAADLMHRVYETGGLHDLDRRRQDLRREKVSKDERPYPYPSELPPFPEHRRYSLLAQDVHRTLSASIDVLRDRLSAQADRIRRLVRPPYGLLSERRLEGDGEGGSTRRFPWQDEAREYDMRMPPYMRDSDRSPLSLTRRQYVRLMTLVEEARPPGASPAETYELAPDRVGEGEKRFGEFQRTDLTAHVPSGPAP